MLLAPAIKGRFFIDVLGSIFFAQINYLIGCRYLMNTFIAINDIEFMIFNGNILKVKLTLLIFVVFLSGKQKKLKFFTKYIYFIKTIMTMLSLPRSVYIYWLDYFNAQVHNHRDVDVLSIKREKKIRRPSTFLKSI